MVDAVIVFTEAVDVRFSTKRALIKKTRSALSLDDLLIGDLLSLNL